MRRTGATLALVLLLLSITALAGASTRTVADDFSSGGYSGSTGSQSWASNWTEVGEADGATKGNVRVTSSGCSGSCLRIALPITLNVVGATRRLDLSEATEANLSYALEFPPALAVVYAEVAARIDGGNWNTLTRHEPGAEGVFHVPLPVGGQVTIRLQATSVLSVASEMMWDDVVIEFDVPDVTTTTLIATTITTTTTTTPLPTLTVPTVTVPTVTVPTVTAPTVTVLTTTTTATTSTPSTRATTTTTSATTARQPTTTRPTTTTTARGDTTTTPTVAPTTSTSQPPTTNPEDPADDPLTASAPPSQTFGVITGIEPGIAAPALDIAAQRGFVIDFVLSAEDIRLDLVANLVVGLVLAWLSVKSLDRRQP
jgi:hypothetical protein